MLRVHSQVNLKEAELKAKDQEMNMKYDALHKEVSHFLLQRFFVFSSPDPMENLQNSFVAASTSCLVFV